MLAKVPGAAGKLDYTQQASLRASGAVEEAM